MLKMSAVRWFWTIGYSSNIDLGCSSSLKSGNFNDLVELSSFSKRYLAHEEAFDSGYLSPTFACVSECDRFMKMKGGYLGSSKTLMVMKS